MPYTFLNIKRPLDEGTESLLNEKLPVIVAEELSVKGAKVHEGGLTPAEIMVWPFSNRAVVNGKDVEIIVFVHPFRARKKNIEARKDAIIRRLKQELTAVYEHLTFAVCIIMAPMAYGEAKVINPMP